MDVQLLAYLLLIGRVVSEFFIVKVLIRQWKIRKIRTHPRLMAMRRVLTLLAVLVFVGNLYPLGLDIYTIFNPEIRTNPKVNLIGVIYSLDNSISFMLLSILVWTLYKLADVVIEVAELITGKPIKDIPKMK